MIQKEFKKLYDQDGNWIGYHQEILFTPEELKRIYPELYETHIAKKTEQATD